MPLNPNMGRDEAIEHLRMLTRTIQDDIEPLLNTCGKAPFAIAREVFSYVDYLGSLRYGRSGSRDMSRYAKRFIAKYMGSVVVDTAYRTWGSEIYEMYRHGTIHNFEPQRVTLNGTDIYKWLAYAGNRTDLVKWPDTGREVEITHLRPIQCGGGEWYLPVSTRCLIEDLKAATKEFEKDLATYSATLLPKWNKFASFLSKPKQL